jgi:hemerythrin-like metal-binding protein
MTLPLGRQTLIGAGHALGHSQIDSEHFAIADCWSQTIRAAPAGLPLTIARLRKVMRRHFEHESRLIEAAGVKFCACHRVEHEAMLSLCDDAYVLAERDRRASQILLRKLPRLMKDHIICTDQIAVLMMQAAERERAARILP